MNVKQILSMMNNPQFKALMNSKNPQQAALNIIKNSPNANTEMGKNVIGMIERGDYNALEQYGKNLMQSQGINPSDVENMLKNISR